VKFGVLQFFSWSRRIPLEEVYERAFQRIAIMDETGYDTVWLAEHHFNTYSVCPSIHLMGTWVAARTKNLRIGTAVSLAAMYHPLRLAEEVALLDVLSGGRVNWGVGRGFDAAEFRNFGVPIEESSERMHEAAEIVMAAWAPGRLNYRGRFWQFEGVEVLPKPAQQPHPPFWMAATSPESIEKAAAKGYSILMDPHASHAEIGRKRRLYFEALAKHGHPTEGRVLPTARLLAVAPTDAAAAEAAREGARWTLGSYAGPVSGRHGRQGGIDTRHDKDPVDRYVDEVIIHGSPARVVDEVRRLREEIGLDYLMCAPLSHESFMLFTEQVLPHLH
jgi:alkanesulfonate monooxygenase SsuD/methylene tetrahydromethanopterin reductase-like flavin-dependent oxidoreductase (luciferase family)